ncbi:hypothetical protein N9D72_03380 [Porticoccaceae bacterium]|nr:hypothetical protein [Porticoccaceae bacterium]
MDHFFEFCDIETDAKPAAWAVKRCIGPKHTLHTIVPSGFASYVRICHPGWSFDALDPNDEEAWAALRAGWVDARKLTPVRWDDVEIANNRRPHRLMQFFQTFQKPGTAAIDGPLEGELTVDMMESLFAILAEIGGPHQQVFCGIWEGFNLPIYRQARVRFETYSGQQSYLLFSSTLSRLRDCWLAAYEHAINRHGIGVAGLVPNAIWPTTCDWFLASPYNRPSSYFGGSTTLVNKILHAEVLETYKALPGDNIYK